MQFELKTGELTAASQLRTQVYTFHVYDIIVCR